MTIPQPIHTRSLKSAPPTSGKMSISAITKGVPDRPKRVLVYGPEKVGKTSFAAGAPAPIFLCAEDGFPRELADKCQRFPEPETWGDVLHAVRVLTDEAHPYKTLVLDTIDWMEPLCHRWVCERAGKDDIEAFGYGKGHAAALDEWRVLVAALDRLRKAKGMDVLLLGHSAVKSFKSPDTEDYDRYSLKIHAGAAGLIKEWCDAILFARYEEYVSKDDRTKRVRAVSTGARVLHTTRTAAYDAGNRYNLPPVLPMSYAEFALSVEHGGQAVEVITAAIEEALATLADPAVEKSARELMAKAAKSAADLAKILDRLNLRIQQKGEK